MKIYNFIISSGIALLLVISLFLYNCQHDPFFINEIDTVCFERQILPVLQNSCGYSGCHDGTGELVKITDYESIMTIVNPGDVRGSKLYKVITNIYGENQMPPDFPLSKENRTLIHLWIAQGALNIKCPVDTGSNNNNGNTGGPGPIVNSDSICFQQKILPLISSNCAMPGCHDGNSQGEDDNVYALNSYTAIRQHVVPFNTGRSSIYKAVTGSGEDFMPPPPKPALTSAQKDLLKKWINEGALNSDCPDVNCDTSGTISYLSQVKPTIDNYCVSCHNASVTSGGVNLNGHNQVKVYAESIRNAKPVLVGTIRHLTGFKAMPPTSSLDDCSIRKIELWIEQGRLNN